MEVTQEMIEAVLADKAGLAAIEKQATSIAEKSAQGLMNKNAELLSEVKTLKTFKKSLGEEFTVEILDELKEQAALGTQGKAIADKDMQKLIDEHSREKDELIKTHARIVGEKDDSLSTLNTKMHKTVLENSLTRGLSGVAVDDDAIDFLKFKYMSHLELEEKGDGFNAKWKDQINADGTSKGVNELIAHIKEDEKNARYIKGVNSGGSGAPSNGSSGAGISNENMTSQQRIAAGLKARGA